jgi:multidrug efflux pump subunit AcrA (membrane-fusion protein)
MKTLWLLIVILVSLVALGGHIALRGTTDRLDLSRHKAPVYSPNQIAANGVVEGARPEVALRPEITATVVAIHFWENQDVTKGDVLVELSNGPQQRQVELAEAEVMVAKAELERLRNGERPEKRKAVAALERVWQAVLEHANADWDRAQRLAGTKTISPEQRDAAYFQMQRAQAQLAQLPHLEKISADFRPLSRRKSLLVNNGLAPGAM